MFKLQKLWLTASRPQMVYLCRPIMPVQQRFVRSMDERKEEQDRKAFVDDINYFLSKDQFNFNDFHERVLTALKQKSGIK